MLHILVGDTAKAKKKAQTLSKGHEVVRFGEGGEPFESALGYLSARGLFSPKVALLFDRPLESPEGATFIEAHMKEFAAGDALTILVESSLPAALKKKIPKNASLEVFEEKHTDDTPLPSVFSLTDAFVSGDRKKTWVLYRTFIEEGVAPEEIHGALSWQVRALVLASKTNSAAESGLKPFVFTKAKRASARIPSEQAEQMSRELVSVYHRARKGEGELVDLLEMFLLKKS